LDDILIDSNSIKEHEEHVMWIMERLFKTGLYLKPEKSEFNKENRQIFGTYYINKRNIQGFR